MIFPPELINNPLTCKQGTETTPSSPGGRCEGGAEPLPPLWPLGCYPGMICIICVCVCVCVCVCACTQFFWTHVVFEKRMSFEHFKNQEIQSKNSDSLDKLRDVAALS